MMQLWKALKEVERKEGLVFVTILLVAAFLRFYRMPELMPFSGDQGRDMLAAAKMVETGEWPLLGGQSSLEKFKHGPLYIWMSAGILRIANFDPAIVGLFASAVGLMTVGVLYIFCRTYFSVRVAQIASLILAASPLVVTHSRTALHINPVSLTTLAYVWLLVEFYYGRAKAIWTALVLGILFQFELAAAPMVLLLVYAIWLKRKKLTKRDYRLIGTGLILGLLPQVIFDLGNRFKQLGLFIAWIGYRVVSFLGFDAEHRLSLNKWRHFLITSLESTQQFFSGELAWPTAIMLIGLGLWLSYTKKRKKQLEERLLVIWLVLILASFLVLGAFYDVHFGLVFVPLAILIGLMVEKLRPSVARLITIMLITLAAFNATYLVKNDFLVKTPFSEQLKVTKIILDKTKGPIFIKTNDKVSRSSSEVDNYIYLVKYLGGREIGYDGWTVWIMPKTDNLVNPLDAISYELDSVVVSIGGR